MRPVKRKVMAYITNGTRLLVFREPDFPDAGIQVPGGSVADNEELAAAAIREAEEETGLIGLTCAAFIGETRFDLAPYGRPEIFHRHYYHLTVDGILPETWHHFETDPSEGVHERILFELFWADLPDGVPRLQSSMDEMLPALMRRMGLR